MITAENFNDNAGKRFGKGASAKSRRGVPNGLDELYINKLKVIYTAEKHILDMLPKMIQILKSYELKSVFEKHLEIRIFHISQLEKIFSSLNKETEIANDKVMNLLVEDVEKAVKSKVNEHNLDLKILTICQKIEIYQIAIYSSLYSFSKALEEEFAAELIKELLEQEISIYDKTSMMAVSYLRKMSHKLINFIPHSSNSRHK